MSISKSLSYDYIVKLILIGNSGVGKTCFLQQFTDKKFNETFISTVGIDFKIKTLKIKDKVIKLQIWDTAGQERFRNITSAYYRGAMGIIMMYDITDRSSFDAITTWIRNIRVTIGDKFVNQILVGNKCDSSTRRVVTYEEGLHLSKTAFISENKKDIVDFIETSAKNNTSIDDTFNIITTRIYERLIIPHENKDEVINITKTEEIKKCC